MEGFVKGARVTVDGLQSNPEHNGKNGVIIEEFPDERMAVILDDGEIIKVGTHRLKLIPISPMSLSEIITPAMAPQVADMKLLDLTNRQIIDLNGVEHLVSLKELRVGKNRIDSLKGVRFPDSLMSLILNANQIGNLDGVVFPGRLKILDLSENQIGSLRGFRLPDSLKILNLSGNQIGSLRGFRLPDSLQTLNLANNQIGNLDGVVFPGGLKILNLSNNEIIDIRGVRFPDSLQVLDLSKNQIRSLGREVVLPGSLRELELLDNQIDSLHGFEIPSQLVRFNMHMPSKDTAEGNSIRRKLLKHTQAQVATMDPRRLAEILRNADEPTSEAVTSTASIYHSLVHASSVKIPKKCSVCGKVETDTEKMKKCSRCDGPRLYCSKECQANDWENHKKICFKSGSSAESAKGGNKSKTRRQRRQSKRSKMQRKYKSSRRRRNSK
jgi:hypothetical protein